MATLTNAEALEKFCIIARYDLMKQTNETKAQFLTRWKNKAGKRAAKKLIEQQLRVEKLAEAKSQTDGLDV